VTAADAARALEAGVSEAALRDAVWVCVCFSIFTRVADGLGFTLLDEAGYRRSGQFLWRRGYIL